MLEGLPQKVERYLDLLSARQKLVARNIANVDTPGYKTQDIEFQTELQRVMEGGNSPRAIDAEGLTTKADGNNVSLDREARMLTENDIRFNIATQLLKGQIHHVRMAINEGRGS